jgi:hypothetical protein
MLGWFRKRKSSDSTSDRGGAAPGPDSPVLAIQGAYWSPDPAELGALRSRDIASLSWAELLRLHHLNCIEYLWEGGEQAAWRRDEASDATETATPALARCGETAQRLLAPESPYRARHCSIFHGENAGPEPDLQGWTRNASLTHLGALEVIRLDNQHHPREIAFVPLDDLRAVVFASPSVFRGAKLFYDDGRADEIVLVPLLYAWTWLTRDEILRSGRLTRLFGYTPVGDESIGLGIGHQDFFVNSDGQLTLLGFGSARELAVALEATDPRFDLKCRARGADPDEIRRAIAAQGEGG